MTPSRTPEEFSVCSKASESSRFSPPDEIMVYRERMAREGIKGRARDHFTLRIEHCTLSISFFIFHFSFFIFHLMPTADRRPLTADRRPLTADCRPPTVSATAKSTPGT